MPRTARRWPGLAGLLADIPFALEWHVPTEKVVTAWRVLVPAGLMEALFWRAAGPLTADDEPSAALLAGLVRRRPELFAGRVICFDRNFPGYDLITAIVAADGHVVARVKEGISLPLQPGGGWLPDGSRLTWLNAPSGKK